MEKNEPEIINVEYTRPPFWKRIFANLLDFIILAILTLVLFIPTRAIAQSFTSFKNAELVINEEKLQSGLYVNNENDELISIVASIDRDVTLSSIKKTEKIEESISYFINIYIVEEVSIEKSNTIKDEYDSYRLNEKLKFDNQTYFIKSGEEVIKNPDCTADSSKYYNNVYKPFVESNLESDFLNYVPQVKKATSVEANLLMFFEVPIAYGLAAFLTFILPTLIFRRNRSTIGRLVYAIGLVDKDMLSVKGKTLLVKNLIFYFAEAILSLFTFGIPLIVTASMMIFSKKGQGFADFMVNIQEIDLNSGNIFHSKEEVIISQINANKKAVNFKAKKL